MLAITLALLLAGIPVHASNDQCWTLWFARDNPSGHGGFETLAELHKENPSKICDHPIEIEVQTTSGASVGSANNVIHVLDTRRGFICRNLDQLDRGCADYKVRFLCPLEFCNPKGCWTTWFDRDNPSGHGDFETLLQLHKENPSKICDHPIQIEIKTASGASVGSTHNVIHASDTLIGFVCRNGDQPPNVLCADYKVHFLCPLEFCKPKINKVCRTQWYNHNNPCGTRDFELLEKLRVENPNEICPFPLDIEVQTVVGNTLASTGDDIAVSDTTTVLGSSVKMLPRRVDAVQIIKFASYVPLISVIDKGNQVK